MHINNRLNLLFLTICITFLSQFANADRDHGKSERFKGKIADFHHREHKRQKHDKWEKKQYKKYKKKKFHRAYGHNYGYYHSPRYYKKKHYKKYHSKWHRHYPYHRKYRRHHHSYYDKNLIGGFILGSALYHLLSDYERNHYSKGYWKEKKDQCYVVEYRGDKEVYVEVERSYCY